MTSACAKSLDDTIIGFFVRTSFIRFSSSLSSLVSELYNQIIADKSEASLACKEVTLSQL